MSYFNKQDLLARSGITNFSSGGERYVKAATASLELVNESRTYQSTKVYDVFLSHSFDDALLIRNLRDDLTSSGLAVYVDWIEDPALDRSKVTTGTAGVLRERMKSCKSLLYATSENAKNSLWMPWELGFFDGLKHRVAVLPIAEDNSETPTFQRREYLGLYPYIDTSNGRIWVNEDGKYVTFEQWVAGLDPYKH